MVAPPRSSPRTDTLLTYTNGTQLASALVKLYRDNATTLTPDALYSRVLRFPPTGPDAHRPFAARPGDCLIAVQGERDAVAPPGDTEGTIATTEQETSVGRVIASHGRHVMVEASDERRVPCSLSARRLQVVCGDEVRWRLSDSAGTGVVVDRLPRRSTLSRTNTKGQNEVVVANISQLIVVFAPEPTPDFFIVDRYIAAAELHGLKAVVVLNKCELISEPDACDVELATFAQIGYPTARCSATTGDGMPALSSRLEREVSVLVGQSGVGRSRLSRTPSCQGLDAETAVLSRGTMEGPARDERVNAASSAQQRRPDRLTGRARLRASTRVTD